MKKETIKKYNVCYKCCASNKHMARNCKAAVKCSECDSDKHATALHPDAEGHRRLKRIAHKITPIDDRYCYYLEGTF